MQRCEDLKKQGDEHIERRAEERLEAASQGAVGAPAQCIEEIGQYIKYPTSSSQRRFKWPSSPSKILKVQRQLPAVKSVLGRQRQTVK